MEASVSGQTQWAGLYERGNKPSGVAVALLVTLRQAMTYTFPCTSSGVRDQPIKFHYLSFSSPMFSCRSLLQPMPSSLLSFDGDQNGILVPFQHPVLDSCIHRRLACRRQYSEEPYLEESVISMSVLVLFCPVNMTSLINTLRTRSFKLFKRPFPGFLTILTL